MTTVEDQPPVKNPDPNAPAKSLLSGLLLMVVVPGLVMLLACLNCAILALALRLFGFEDSLTVRGWLIPLSILCAIAELAFYEWRCARAVNLVPSIQTAIRELCDAVQMIENSNRVGKQYFPVMSERLRQLQAEFKESDGPVLYSRFALAIQELREVLVPRMVLLEDAECDQFQRFNTLLEWYQRQQFRVVLSLFPLHYEKPIGPVRLTRLRNDKPGHQWCIFCLRDVLVHLERLLYKLKANKDASTDHYLLLLTVENFYTKRHNLPDALLFDWVSRVVDKARPGRLPDNLSDEGSDCLKNILHVQQYLKLVLDKKTRESVNEFEESPAEEPRRLLDQPKLINHQN